MTLARIDIEDLTKRLAKDLKKFERDAVPIAEKAALLRASRSARSRWIKGVSKRTRVKQKLIRTRSGNRALRGGVGRIITMNGAPIPVSILGPKGKLPKATRNGIRIAGRHYPKGFIARNKFGRREAGATLFQREGDSRGPIDEIRENIDQAVQQVGPPAVRRAIDQRYPKEFQHALDRELRRRTRAK